MPDEIKEADLLATWIGLRKKAGQIIVRRRFTTSPEKKVAEEWKGNPPKISGKSRLVQILQIWPIEGKFYR